jgi:UDP-N-acetylmuramoyl-tripeptide--D-alanyl-D-alanine ligase
MKLGLAEVARFIHPDLDFELSGVATGYSIDSRTIQSGELFFAVRGERLDGHDYVEAALAKGAIAAVVSRESKARFADKAKLLAVDDPLKALQQLAAAVRLLWGKPLIGITGSAGKTTTKEIVAHLLAARYNVLKSQGNLNNHFGLPLQLLNLEPEHEFAVIEVGMSHAGEIRALASLARPDCGVVTLVAPVHLEFFDSIADIARAKYELIESLPAGGIAVLNADDPYVSQFGQDFRGKVVTFGLQKPADVSARNVEARGPLGSAFELVTNGESVSAGLPLLGEHSIYNALAGVAVGLQYGIGLQQAAKSLASLSAGDKRGQVIEVAGATVINDCYNSNPKALDSMVRALASMPAQRRIVVAGEMLELGTSAEDLHRENGRHMGPAGVTFVLGVRGLAQFIVEGAAQEQVPGKFVESPEEAGTWLLKNVKPGDLVLLKASRGVRLERALDVWMGKSADKPH